mmetsp:Transcript_6831/g.5833  ORF Transcript_6831/g.5833 Transcript_6831/m.5833 type:complete len:166 (+) Transcript_6831:3-500(+)
MRQAMAKYKQQAKQLLRHMNSFPPQCSIDTGAYVFHYITDGGIVYMTLCDQRYPKKLAFSFLEEIRQAFVEELAREFGTTDSLDYRQHIEAINKPYHFISFDRQITKRRNDYRDPTSTKALNRLNDSLTELVYKQWSRYSEVWSLSLSLAFSDTSSCLISMLSTI